MSRYGFAELRTWLDSMEERNAIEPISSLTAWLDPDFPSILEDYVHTLDGFRITHEERLMLESAMPGLQETAPNPKTKRVRWNDNVITNGGDADISTIEIHEKRKSGAKRGAARARQNSSSSDDTQEHQHDRQIAHKQRRQTIKARSQRKSLIQPEVEPHTSASDARQLFMLQPTSPSDASSPSYGSMPATPSDDASLSPGLESCIMIPWNDDDFSD